MRRCISILPAALLLFSLPRLGWAAGPSSTFIYETPNEFFGNGDFDGDGRTDLIIVDKASGKYRLGYQTAAGLFSWVDCRPSGIKGVSGVGIGKFLAQNLDAFAFTSPDA